MNSSLIKWCLVSIIASIISMALGLAVTLFLMWLLNSAMLAITVKQSVVVWVGISMCLSFVSGYLTMKIKDNNK